jgi:hypothetical protein
MTLPKYRETIKDMSDETGVEDRLACRNRAAVRLIEQMSDEEREEVTQARDDLHEESVGAWTSFQMMKDGDYDVSEETQAEYVPYFEGANYADTRQRCRNGLTRLLQPILDLLRKLTGLSFFLVAGLEYDYPDGGTDILTTMYVLL